MQQHGYGIRLLQRPATESIELCYFVPTLFFGDRPASRQARFPRASPVHLGSRWGGGALAKAGFVKVALSPRECAASAHWLLSAYITPEPTLLGSPDDSERARANADRLAVQLGKAARRRTGEQAARLLDRRLAGWFGGLLDGVVLGTMPRPPASVSSAMHACRRAALLRR